jgi:hypothetical protein
LLGKDQKSKNPKKTPPRIASRSRFYENLQNSIHKCDCCFPFFPKIIAFLKEYKFYLVKQIPSQTKNPNTFLAINLKILQDPAKPCKTLGVSEKLENNLFPFTPNYR